MTGEPPAPTALTRDAVVRKSVAAGWPPRQDERGDGYLALPLGRMHLLDVASLDDAAGSPAVAVVADEQGATATVPLVREAVGWRVARAGDGVTSLLLERLQRVAPTAAAGGRPGFHLERLAALPESPLRERALGTDQSHTSVVVGDTVIVKWRTAPAPGGMRALRLRRHLQEVGSVSVPPLLGALTWRSPSGRDAVLADVDGYLEHASDGWDALIADLLAWTEAGRDGPIGGWHELGHRLGTLTAELHVALRRPSSLVPQPVAAADGRDLARWREAGLEAIARAVAIEAEDREVVAARAAALRAEVETLAAIDATALQLIHGDLHIGQLVRWSDGLAIIDFDGPPQASGAEGDLLAPVARDVAQMLCSLDHLAVVADMRSGHGSSARLARWASRARGAFLDAYREASSGAGRTSLLDERLLRPFIAEQLCRELAYSAEVLPRWRYAPIGALRWRYPGSGP